MPSGIPTMASVRHATGRAKRRCTSIWYSIQSGLSRGYAINWRGLMPPERNGGQEGGEASSPRLPAGAKGLRHTLSLSTSGGGKVRPGGSHGLVLEWGEGRG